MRVLAGLATLAVALPAGAPSPAARASARHERVYVASTHCRGHTFMPERITLSCRYANVYATEVHFFTAGSAGYGTAEAAASATIHVNTCQPSCSAGRFILDKGALTLERVVHCKDGRLYYSRARYASPDVQGQVDIQPPERCSAVAPARTPP
jgi:hypothetical protein